MFEITSPYSSVTSYEHTCGITPNRPLQARYMFASLSRRSRLGQLVLRTTVSVMSDKFGSSSARAIFQGLKYLSWYFGWVTGRLIRPIILHSQPTPRLTVEEHLPCVCWGTLEGGATTFGVCLLEVAASARVES